jgi:hypothetical protein
MIKKIIIAKQLMKWNNRSNNINYYNKMKYNNYNNIATKLLKLKISVIGIIIYQMNKSNNYNNIIIFIYNHSARRIKVQWLRI